MGSVLRWLPLGLLALLTACGPVYRARAEPPAVPIGTKGWGNGVRMDDAAGWTDTILRAPGGPIQWSWAPGANRQGERL